MELSELRIGNAVQTKGPEFYCPTIVTPDLLYQLIAIGTSDFLPIPIIMSQMERLGFEYKNRQYIQSNHVLKDQTRYRFVLTISDKIELWKGAHVISPISDKEFKYIHEVQNVWYELTGEELTYKID